LGRTPASPTATTTSSVPAKLSFKGRINLDSPRSHAHFRRGDRLHGRRARSVSGATARPRSAGQKHLREGLYDVAGLRRLVVYVTLARRVHPSQAGDEYRNEQSPGNLLDHAYATRRPRERRHVSETRAREHGNAQVKRIGIDQSSRLPDDHVRLGIEESDDRV